MSTNVVIVGGGRGGSAMLDLLCRDKTIKVLAIIDIKEEALAAKLAKKHEILFYSKGLESFLESNSPLKINLIIDCTGDPDNSKKIEKNLLNDTEVIGGLGAKLLWQLIEERRNSEKALEKSLKEHRALYDLGLILTQSKTLKDIFTAIIEYATQLTNSPAGSLAVFDESSGEMYFGAAHGFSSDFVKDQVWRIRKGGLTSYILNQESPVIISDVSKYAKFDNPLMLEEGVKSLLAIPLKSEGQIQGILYIDDFKAREFTSSELLIAELLSNMAAIAIERIKLLESTRILAITDELTKLYNLRHFLNRLSEEIKRCKRYSRSLSLAMIDIDHFKKYNDTYGHVEGNKVLKRIALIFESESREGDIVARYGGEEFAIIMPEIDKEKAKLFAERIRQKVEMSFCKNEPGQCVTISVGVANLPEDCTDAASLIELADEALYKAKNDGRNCVRLLNSNGDEQLRLY